MSRKVHPESASSTNIRARFNTIAQRAPQPRASDMPEASTIRYDQAPDTTSISGTRIQTGLYRAKKPLSFQIATAQPPTVSTKTTSMSAPESPVSSTVTSNLEKRVFLIDLIHRRNKNQHRTQAFFKHLSLLRSSLKRLLETQLQLDKLSRETMANAESVRRRFEQENLMRGRREVLEVHIRETLVPICYVSFSGLVWDPQFANLGVVLFGLLGEIAAGHDEVGVPRSLVEEGTDAQAERTGHGVAGREAELGKESESRRARSLVGMSTRVTGEDQGEVIERVYESDNSGEVDVPANVEEGVDSGADGMKGQMPRASKGQEDRFGAGAAGMREAFGRSSPAVTKAKSGSETRPRKKKRKNAIDDLFSGLI